jgi:hypothetical protein
MIKTIEKQNNTDIDNGDAMLDKKFKKIAEEEIKKWSNLLKDLAEEKRPNNRKKK